MSEEVRKLSNNYADCYSFQVWEAWAKINANIPENMAEVLSQAIWISTYIRKPNNDYWYIPQANYSGIS